MTVSFWFITCYVKKMTRSLSEGIWKGYLFPIKGIRKGCLFWKKWYIKAEPPRIKLFWVPPRVSMLLTYTDGFPRIQVASTSHCRWVEVGKKNTWRCRVRGGLLVWIQFTVLTIVKRRNSCSSSHVWIKFNIIWSISLMFSCTYPLPCRSTLLQAGTTRFNFYRKTREKHGCEIW